MKTRVLTVDPVSPDAAAIAETAEVLRGGGLVAFPTETVYGLGANALDPEAVASIYAAKGRPAANPIIVHVADADRAKELVTDWPETADKLARRFWPGPITFVLPKAPSIPTIVTAGGNTVAVRVPSHPVARALLIAAEVPVAAPSANRSSQISPTQASHVLRGLNGRIDVLLDGGPSPGGIESTVIDLTVSPPRILRPGLVTLKAVEAVIGAVQGPDGAAGRVLRSPGMLARHYAPAADIEIEHGNSDDRVGALVVAGLRVGWITMNGGLQAFGRSDVQAPADGAIVIDLPGEPAGYSAGLYAVLHAMDDAGVDRIVIQAPPDTPEWLAVWDRLRRASAL